MYFKELQRARRAVIIYAIVWAAIFAFSSILTLWFGMQVDVDSSIDGASAAGPHAANLLPLPWTSLFGPSAVFAAVIATILGSTLAQEADGHLEFALTKPRSRTAYASTMIAVDLAAVTACTLIGFVFMVLHVLTFHHRTSAIAQGFYLVQGSDAFFVTLRFLLFPLAWYAVVAGITAGMRAKAGIAQGLIWPVTLLLSALQFTPVSFMGPGWHAIISFVNFFNPLTYAAFGASQSGDFEVVGPTIYPSLVASIALLVFLVVGWAAATAQWRRAEA